MKCFHENTRRCSRTFEEWRDGHPRGFVLNRRASKTFMLHRANCIHLQFKPGEPVVLTRKAKWCSDDRAELELSVDSREGIAIVLCRRCEV